MDGDNLRLALDLAEAGELTRARAILEILVGRYPNEADVAQALGAVLFRMDRPEGGLVHFHRAAVLTGGGDGHWWYHGLQALVQRGDGDGALALHARAVALLVDRHYLPSLALALLPR